MSNSTNDLRAGMDQALPLGLQLREIFHRSIIVAVKVHSVYRVAIIEVDVDLSRKLSTLTVLGKPLMMEEGPLDWCRRSSEILFHRKRPLRYIRQSSGWRDWG